MIRETVSPLRAEVHKWLPVFQLSQNAFAKYCKVHPSIASRVLNGALVSEPAEKKMARGLERLKRRVVARESKAAS